ncbi:MAG: response regulator transcription factor [Clostridia bacterium]|nr:response regulator transcription factor [Clostridia bacterium]
MARILIAEDDADLRTLFAHVLEKQGYTVRQAGDGMQALNVLAQERFDLLISDVMMPLLNGNALVQRLRDAGNTMPILLITAKGDLDDMRLGFSSGADDYMVKPVNVGEMTLRVSALLRRAKIQHDRRLRLGGTELEFDSFSLLCSGKREVLPQKEFLLLYKLSSDPGKIFTKQQLMDAVWGYDSFTDAHTVEVHIGRLREKLADNPDIRIVTMRGVGYKVELK